MRELREAKEILAECRAELEAEGVKMGPVEIGTMIETPAAALCADELAEESLNTLLGDMPVAAGEEVALLINGLGATSAEELYILSNSVSKRLEDKGISIYRTFVGEFATSMEMAGASISIMKLDDETRAMLDMPVSTPFYCQK